MIKTNRLISEGNLDREKIAEAYAFYYIRTVDKAFKMGSHILDFEEGCGIESLCYRRNEGNILYIMVSKRNTAMNGDKLLRAIKEKTEERQSLSCGACYVDQLEDALLYQLLLNAVRNPLHGTEEALTYSNLTGHFYSLHPRNTKGSKEINALKFTVTHELDLCIQVETFTNIALRKGIDFKGGKTILSYPHYGVDRNQQMKRLFLPPREIERATLKDQIYIQRQRRGRRATVPFLSFKDLGAFRASKMGQLDAVVRAFNKRYAGCARMAFETIETLQCECDPASKYQKVAIESLKALLATKGLHIVDSIGSQESKALCESLEAHLLDSYGVVISTGQTFEMKKLNLQLILPVTAFTSFEQEDHYQKSDGLIIQHVTMDAFGDKKDTRITVLKPIVYALLTELAIKASLQECSFLQIENWKTLNLQGRWQFIERVGEQEGNEAGIMRLELDCMSIDADGRFCIEKIGFDPTRSEDDLYTKVMLAVVAADREKRSSETLHFVCNPEGEVAILRQTKRFPIPDVDAIYNTLKEGQKLSRSKQGRSKYFRGLLDIMSFEQDSKTYYISGVLGKGMQNKPIQTSSHIYELESLGDGIGRRKPFKIEAVLPMMAVTFVRKGQLTVYPYPFKYLREYRALKL